MTKCDYCNRMVDEADWRCTDCGMEDACEDCFSDHQPCLEWEPMAESEE